MRRMFQDWRWWLLLAAAGLLAAVMLRPYGWRERPGYPLVAVVDITRSMNTRDMHLGGEQVDRLSFVKARLRGLLRRLPCGSRLGVGVFTERRSTLLLLPVEVCGHFHELSQVIEQLDWRMAWAADSRVAKGLLDAMMLLRRTELQRHALLFFTDGHEAPPVNPRYRTDFTEVKGKVAGLLVGVGGRTLSPIPKFDERGRFVGFYRPEDVPHRSTFGEPLRKPTGDPSYHPRNAPFGGEWVLGQEHLSSLRAGYLRQLAEEAGLAYHTLGEPDDLLAAIDALGVRLSTRQPRDWRPWLGALAGLLLAGVYLGTRWWER
ncbi:TPA: VWA domain-containing protein [Candidatus Micrarchaeota archaeon]|nr:VWA domain-containing protein [Candidatus Micrarchaeota archaeon]